MKSRLLFVAATLTCGFSTQARLHACECVGPVTPCLAMERAQAVFVGEVTEIAIVDQPSRPQSSFPVSRRVSFKVSDTLRGDLTESVQVYTGSGGGDCGFSFTKGKSYLVYAHRATTGQLATSICERTKEVTRAAQNEIKELRLLAQEPRKCTQQ